MKKILTMTIALIALTLTFSSCTKKKVDEPVITKPPCTSNPLCGIVVARDIYYNTITVCNLCSGNNKVVYIGYFGMQHHDSDLSSIFCMTTAW